MYSICTNFFPNDKDAMVGYIEAVTGVGLILGPLIGSGLYSLGGYVFIFYSFGSIFIFASFFVKSIFGEETDKMGLKVSPIERANSINSRHSNTDNNY
jgi:MFS family permease